MFKTAAGSLMLLLVLPSAYAGMVTNRDMGSDETFIHLGFSPQSFDNPSLHTEIEPFDQLIDPQNPAAGTFKQRYYLDNVFAVGANAPVFYAICGESECSSRVFSGITADLAAKFHGVMIALEHRYYGKSKPFAKYTRENMVYLTVDNEIADLARFQIAMTQKYGWKGPWIAVGGSYAGSLAAYYRLAHPELVAGALASSAPVEARLNYPEFDFHAATHVPESCRTSVLAADQAAEEALDSPEKLTALKKLFGAEIIRSAADFLFFVADFAAESVQYGTSDDLCKALDPAHPVESYAAYTTKFFGYEQQSPTDNTYQPDLDPTTGEVVLEGSEWTYQSCREFGYWQTPYSVPAQSMRSQAIRLDQFTKLCDDLFGIKDGGAAGIASLNQNYYQKLLNPELASKIIFTNGSQDPWSELSIAEFRHNHVNPKTQTILIEGGSHCSDLHGSDAINSASLDAAIAQITNTVGDWISGR